MNAEPKKMETNLEALRETIGFSMKTIQLIGGSEDAVLSMLGDSWAKSYKSSDDEDREVALIMALEMGIAWNNMVDELGDSIFHKDALTKRFLKIIWEE